MENDMSQTIPNFSLYLHLYLSIKSLTFVSANNALHAKMKKQSLFLLFCLLAAISGCDIINPKEALPIYIRIDHPRALVYAKDDCPKPSDPAYYYDSGIKYVYVNQGSEEIGFFELPCVIPVYPDKGIKNFLFTFGSNQVEIGGLNGSASTYPFWKPVSVNVNVNPLDTFVLDTVKSLNKLTLRYYSDTVLKYAYQNKFESATTEFDYATPGNEHNVSFVVKSSDKHQGCSAGYAAFDSIHTDLDIQTAAAFELPFANVTDMYLEVTYKGDVPFTTGLISTPLSSGVPTSLNWGAFLYSPDEWRTAYIRLNDVVAQAGALIDNSFKVYFRAKKKETEPTGKLWIDNVRVIYRK